MTAVVEVSVCQLEYFVVKTNSHSSPYPPFLPSRMVESHLKYRLLPNHTRLRRLAAALIRALIPSSHCLLNEDCSPWRLRAWVKKNGTISDSIDQSRNQP
jgi:hypothetical protein